MADGKSPSDVVAMTASVFHDSTTLDFNPDAPMTDLQIAELRQLADRVGEPFAATLTRREAQERIGYLRGRL